MAEVSPSPNKRGALRIGDAMLRSAKSFKKGIGATFSLGRDVIVRSSAKIASTQKKIKLERKRQDDLDDKTRETAKRKTKEASIESRKIGGSVKPVAGVIKKALMTPIEAALKLFAAWAVKNLPLITKKIRIFVKKVRIASASINYMIRSTVGLFKSLGKIASAFIKNLSEFDFNDSKKRIERAKAEFDENIEEIGIGFDEFKNVWGREEEELDIILKELDNQATLRAAIDVVTPEAVSEAQTPAVGSGSSYSGPNEMYGMKVDTATDTKWKPILNLIASAESVDGSYSSAYPNKIINGLENMTMAEAIKTSGGTDSSK